MNGRVDSSERTHLAVCGCGWRSPILGSKLAALTSLVRHEREYHPGDQNAYDALYQHHRRRRHADAAQSGS